MVAFQVYLVISDLNLPKYIFHILHYGGGRLPHARAAISHDRAGPAYSIPPC